MNVAGIIAEYNPLHNGHIYHLDQTRKQSGADYVIVLLSGNFVQRGEPACADKLTRAGWALNAGADLVLELPSIYSVGNAERFSLGAVRTLESSGVVTSLSFGCEETDLRILYRLSEILSAPSDAFGRSIHEHLSKGLSFPRAQAEALRSIGTDPRLTEALEKPNNILGIEYLKALRMTRSAIRPIAIRRNDAGYHSVCIGGMFSSSSAIRKALHEKDLSVLASMPSFVSGTLLYNDGYPIETDAFSSMILYALRNMNPEQIREVPDIAEGIENLLIREAVHCCTVSELLKAVKSKRYTLARIKRILICSILGITNSLIRETMHGNDGLYLRVLGFQEGSEHLLSVISQRATAPMIVRKADEQNCSDTIRRNLSVDAYSTDLMRYATGLDISQDHTAPIVI